MPRHPLDLTFLVLLLVAFAVQIPLAWLLWADSSQGGLVRGSAIAGFVLPVVVVVILWAAYIFFDSMVLRIVCWYGILVVVGKAVVIILASIALVPLEAMYSTNLVQVMYPVIPLAIVLYWTRRTLESSKRSLATGIVGGVALAILFADLGVLILLNPLTWSRQSTNSANLDPLWASVIVAAALVIVTLGYLIETRLMRLEARRPSLALEPAQYVLGGSFYFLRLRNTGGLAKDLRIDITDSKGATKWYAPSLSRNGSIMLTPSVREAEQSAGKIDIYVKYQDDRNAEHDVRLKLDFGALKAEDREPVYQMDPLIEVSEALRNIHQDLWTHIMGEVAKRARTARKEISKEQ